MAVSMGEDSRYDIVIPGLDTSVTFTQSDAALSNGQLKLGIEWQDRKRQTWDISRINRFKNCGREVPSSIRRDTVKAQAASPLEISMVLRR